MKDKRLHKFIAITLCVTLLTISASRVTRVSAVGTTIAAAAGASLCAVGIIYCSYMALTGASVHIPDTVENIQSWLEDMGTKVVQYPSGRAAYEELYPELIGIGDEPLHNLLDRAWTWTSDKLKSWANDFSDRSIMSSIAGTYTVDIDVSTIPLNGYEYPFTIKALPTNFRYNGGSIYTLEEFIDYGWSVSIGAGGHSIIWDEMIVPTNYTGQVRNFLRASDGKYIPQYYDGTYWQPLGTFSFYSGYYTWTANGDTLTCVPSSQYVWDNGGTTISGSMEYDYPFFPNDTIYDEETGEYSVLVVPQSTEIVERPQWPVLPPEDDNKPIIPYVKLPYNPNWIDPVTGSPGGGNWGFNLSRLLDSLEELAGLLMEIGAIGELINEFKDLLNGQSGDEYYIYYDDSTHNYYEYYTITNYGDNVYNYNINVSDVDEHLPVNLNSIQTYSNNRYLDTIKQSAINGSSILRDLVVFWYDVDPTIIYIVFGSCIAILLAAFIGKWGHS